MKAEQEWIDLAIAALDKAYVPYSHFPVGACLVAADGTLYQGVNIENASYGATNCGERTAIFTAYANGYRKDDIKAIAIVSNGKRIGTPCGICRQVLSELMPKDAPIILSNGKDEMITNIAELLPYDFGEEDLK